MTHPQLVGLAAMVMLTVPLAQASGIQQQDVRRFDKIEEVVNLTMAEIGLPGTVSTLRVTINPGTQSPVHTHTGRMAVTVMIQGTLTEHRGDVVHVRNAGEVSTVPEGTTHWLENTGTVPVIYAETNIRPK